MKLDSVTISSVTPNKVSAFGGENREARTNRMKAFWSDKANSALYPLGSFLSQVVGGKTLAAHLLAGEEIELPAEIKASNGRVLSLAPGQKISLATIKEWGCPACKSAHGSGEGVSPKQSEALLAGNRFFYNPVTGRIFTISNSCWSEWVKGLGAVKFFVPVPAPEAPKATAKAVPAKA